MNKNYITIAIGVLLLIYVIFGLYRDKQIEIEKSAILTEKLSQLERDIEKNNQITAENELSKRELENQSLERQEQINVKLKNNDCANQFVPVPVSASLYNRAKNIRKSPDSSQSIK